MPELPFLEILAENLAPSISGRRIDAIEIRQPALLRRATPAPESFVGEYLSLPRRLGKYIVLETESQRFLVFHLMRLGRLVVTTPSTAGRPAPRLPKNVSARLALDDGSDLRLIEHGTEKKARLWLSDDLEAIEELRSIGPDPGRGELTLEAFRAAVRGSGRQLKSFLTDQSAMAGIGNGLGDEILFEARLSPLQRTGNLDDDAVVRLHQAIVQVVARQADRLRETMAGALPQREPSELYAVHDHKGDPCPRCGTPIAWISYADRDTFYCPGCQTGGEPLKDRRLSKLLK